MPYLSFDLRALALMRIAVAIVLLLDLSIRMSDLEVFYSNSGVVPLSLLFEHVWNPYFISVHAISGLWQVQFLLFLFSYCCAVMLLLGYRTTLFTALSWFMLLSLHNRNGLILQGGDDMLRMVLFWGMFLPWGKRYSSDDLFELRDKQGTTEVSIAGIAYLLQVCYLYGGSALLKGAEWDTEFSALYYVYSLDQIAFPITQYLFYYPSLLKALTMSAYYFELFVPAMFFIPFKHGVFRTIGVALILIFHLFNELTLLIGLFPAIGIATSLGLLPSSFMNGVEERLVRVRLLLKQVWSRVTIWLSPYLGKQSYQVFPAWRENLGTALMAFLVVYVLDWNYSNLKSTESKLPEHFRFIGYVLRLDQHWGMFAPNVLKDDGWYVLEGMTTKGDTVNVSHPNFSFDYKKPVRLVSHFKNDRWRKYLENYMLSGNDYMRGYFCHYKKRIWNEAHPEFPLKSLRVIYVREFSLPNYKPSPLEKVVLWQCD